jgi:hypothetical protein
MDGLLDVQEVGSYGDVVPAAALRALASLAAVRGRLPNLDLYKYVYPIPLPTPNHLIRPLHVISDTSCRVFMCGTWCGRFTQVGLPEAERLGGVEVVVRLQTAADMMGKGLQRAMDWALKLLEDEGTHGSLAVKIYVLKVG